MTHICVTILSIIGSDNGSSPDRRQAVIWTNAWILLMRILGTSFSEILSEIHTFSFKTIRLQMSSAKCCALCLCCNVLNMQTAVFKIFCSDYNLRFWHIYRYYMCFPWKGTMCRNIWINIFHSRQSGKLQCSFYLLLATNETLKQINIHLK